jgi:hypothetical protein
MLDALRFVATAVAKKDFVPALTHYKIKDGRVTGFNGVISLSSPIDVDLDILPHAQSLLAAIRACAGTISLNMTPTGKLAVKSGKFKSFVECLGQDDAIWVEPEGTVVELGPQFLPGIKAIAPAMGIDASRPWSMGIKLQRQSMFATNNVILTEYWHGAEIPFDVVIPSVAIDELLRIDENPTTVRVTENSIAFAFAGDRWLRSSLVVAAPWPTDQFEKIFGASTGPQLPFPPDFFEAVETLKPFISERGALFMSPSLIATSANDGEGASVEIEIPGVTDMQAYHHKNLELLGELATTIDWTPYPRPCGFRNERLRGAIVGQRV